MEKINKPTRLRTLLLRHLEEINPNVCVDKIEALESDLITMVKGLFFIADEFDLKLSTSNFIGQLD